MQHSTVQYRRVVTLLGGGSGGLLPQLEASADTRVPNLNGTCSTVDTGQQTRGRGRELLTLRWQDKGNGLYLIAPVRRMLDEKESRAAVRGKRRWGIIHLNRSRVYLNSYCI